MADYIVKLSLLSISCIFGSRFVSYLPGIIRHPCIFYKIRIGLRKQDNAPYGYAGLINETNTKQGETNVFVYITYGECPHKHVHVTSDPISFEPDSKVLRARLSPPTFDKQHPTAVHSITATTNASNQIR